nr:reverse transcriptase domain-containing protein [Tanacetum cinerariifolium]
MTLELADRSISRPIGVVEDVLIKVGTFHFLTDFVVVNFDDDPRVPLILARSFLKTERALIDVFEGELTLRVGKEAITFNLDQTSRYSANYNDIRRTELTDFLLEEVDAFIALEDDPTSPEVNQSYVDTEGYILLLEAFLNDDPSLPPPNQGNYLPQVRKELKICKAKTDKSSIDEPPEVELKDLPPHLKYTFLEGDDKLPVIIAKDLSDEEKTTLITVLKSHKRAIAWKLFDIKSINPEFCTHKIIMEDDFEPAVQHQRRVNPKIHDVIKKEVLKLLDAGLIYPVFDSLWSHFMVKEGIVLGHKIYKNGIEVDKAKVDVIAKLPHPTTVKGLFPSSRGNKYILVVVDYLSKWAEATALPTNDARVVCKFLKSLFSRFGTPRAIISDCDGQVEGMLKHKEIYVTPSHTKKIFANMKRVLALETTKADQTLEIRSVKRRVKNLEKKANKKYYKLKRLCKIHSLTRVESSEDAGLGDQEDASKHGRMIDDLNANEGVTLVDEIQEMNDPNMFDTSILNDEEISKPKAKGIVMQEPSERPKLTPIDYSQQSSKAKDKGKAKMIKPGKPLKKKDQIMIDEEVARNLKA